MFNNSLIVLARDFGLVQGIVRLPPGSVELYIEDAETGQNNKVIAQKNR